MNLTIHRGEARQGAILGILLGLELPLFTLENARESIHEGEYEVLVTTSGRVQSGSLWSPMPPTLPLIVVPGRSGIRFHAANWAQDVQGCVGVGMLYSGRTILKSRDALTYLMSKLTLPCFLQVKSL